MSVPQFMIIGAMKAGTTTLYADLATHPDIYLPAEKEPETLVKSDSDADHRVDYRDLFVHAPEGVIKGEGSTAYAKRPDFEGVAEKAHCICGPELKVIYLKRDPLKRIVSHYRHDVGLGLTSLPFEEAVRSLPRYVNYSRYDWQLEPWKKRFGSNVLELSFERYVTERAEVVREVCQFIGVDAGRLPEVDTDSTRNASANRRTAKGSFVRRVMLSRLYQRRVKPLISTRLKEFFLGLVLTKVKAPDVILTDDFAQELRAKLSQPRQTATTIPSRN